jgi:hypothetical protein
MMTREQVFELINREREYQSQSYVPDERISSGLTRRERDAEVSPGILMLEAYVRKATDAWVNTKGSNTPALQQVAKIAAIAVRILEQAADSQVLLEKGLR